MAALRAEKNMRWSDPKLAFSRAVRWVLALWGSDVVPARISDLRAGSQTYLQRATAGSGASGRRSDGAAVGWHHVASAADYLPSLEEGHIHAFTGTRRESVVAQATALATEAGGHIDVAANAALIDEITNLVEEPRGVLGSFDERYLELPDRILTSVMAKHQRYLPVRDADGALLPHFITMANGSCDEKLVAAGNESVLRARYEDALFFWKADLEAERADVFIPGLEQLTFENRLGSVGQRARRIADIAAALPVDTDAEQRRSLQRAGELAKFDLATSLVTEMTSLAGFVAREYATRLGETQQVADALYEMEQPHTSADAIPASLPGALLALGDRFDLLAAMFALGAKPSGSSDPYGLRRAALGVVRILREREDLRELSIRESLGVALQRLVQQGIEPVEDAVQAAEEFIRGRFAQLQRDEGLSAEIVAAVAPSTDQPRLAQDLATELAQLRHDEQFKTLVEAIVRIRRIVPEATAAEFDANILSDEAELELAALLETSQPASGLREFGATHQRLVAPIARFFDETLVMAEDPQLRATRLGLLASVLRLAPRGLDWAAVDAAIS